MYSWEELKQFVDTCSRCSLCRTRTHSVMGRGNLKAPIMFIAEAPGRQEDQQGIPFVGPAGHMFDQLLAAAAQGRTGQGNPGIHGSLFLQKGQRPGLGFPPVSGVLTNKEG